MLVAACPNCGAEVTFRSAVMPVRVCDFCRSLLMRHGDQLGLLGEAASLPDDVSPMRIGTRGEHEDAHFTVVGRMRWRWSGGGWNEWFAVCDDGSRLWLGEAMGRFMLLRDCDYPKSLSAEPTRGQKVVLDDLAYTVADVKTATHAGAEGELPFAPRVGATLRNFDLLRHDGRCACLQITGGRRSASVGCYTDLPSLRATDLRAVPGWPMPNFAHG